MTQKLTLTLLPETLAICRLPPEVPTPAWASGGDFFSITRTRDELSVVAPEGRVPAAVRREGSFRALKVEGPIPFSAVGILAALLDPLARAGISVLALSTFDTDYLLVKQSDLDRVVAELRATGHRVNDQPA